MGKSIEARGEVGCVGFLHSETHSLTIGFWRKKETERKLIMITHNVSRVHALK